MNDTTDQLPMANGVLCYGHVLWEDGHVFRRMMDVDEGKRKKQVEEENMMVGLSREDAVC